MKTLDRTVYLKGVGGRSSYPKISDEEIFYIFSYRLKPRFVKMKMREIFCKNPQKRATKSKCPLRPADIFDKISVC